LLDLGSGTSLNVIDFFSISETGIIISSPEITSILNTYGFIKRIMYKKMERYCRLKEKEKLLEIIKRSSSPENETQIKRISELEKELIKIDPDAKEMMSFVKRKTRANLILNMVKTPGDKKIGDSIKGIVKKYLDLDIEYLGFIESDFAVEKSVRSMNPFLMSFPSASASICLKSILSKITQQTRNKALCKA
jgi:flagellar biosynthesis protein FlhG